MNKCPMFGVCGGCKFDFTDPNYKNQKTEILKDKNVETIWIDGGLRRRADFSFAGGQFGFYKSGSKNIVPITNCPLLLDDINNILPDVAKLPWVGAGGVLITVCDNGIDIAITSNVPYFTKEFKESVDKIGAIRITWNDLVLKKSTEPVVRFADKVVPYPTNAFLQPSKSGEATLRDLIVTAAAGKKRIADLFCGLGAFTYSLRAAGFDIVGPFINRDLFKKPLGAKNLNQYDCVVMDPPRAGALNQSKELVKSNVEKIIYVSCNPDSFARDRKILEDGGYVLQDLFAIDQFVGTSHWEMFGVFKK